MKKIFKRLGFTLAEILIVIGIIGGVAIMVLPTLKDAYEEHVFEARAKSTYNILKQAVALSKYSGDRYYGGDSEVFFNRYIKNSIQLSKICGTSHAECTSDIYASNNLRETNIDDNAYLKAKYSFKLNNGASVRISKVASGLAGSLGIESLSEKQNDILLITFDTNSETEPNILGLDVFVTYWNGRELLPLGNRASAKNVNENCTTDKNTSCTANGYDCGTYCLQYMIDNGWKIKQELKDAFL